MDEFVLDELRIAGEFDTYVREPGVEGRLLDLQLEDLIAGVDPERELIVRPGNLQKLLAASVDDLQTVEGVGEQRARGVREGLSRLAESSILERYV